MIKYYIKAVVELLEAGEDAKEVLKNLEEALVKKGYQGIHLAILQGIVRELEIVKSKTDSIITVADVKDVKALELAITNSLKAIGGTFVTAQIKIDKSITGGYIASHNGQTIDASYKTKLLKLYRTITT